MRAVAGMILMLVATAAGAQDGKYVKDVAHSEINFVAESRLLDAHGFFEKWDADITFDPAAWEKSEVKLVIDAKSINTRVTARDNHLRSKDFFYADSFPQITFASTIVNKMSDTKVNITGDLTIRGVTRQMTIPGTLVFWDEKTRTGRMKGQFTLVRTDFGVSFNSTMNPIADEIPVTFNITFKPKTT
ncbi:MAG: YceI family protein [Gemmatimonadaceae bacterium]|nr:YceI family protein [Gemmatimonadaceae bacterium]